MHTLLYDTYDPDKVYCFSRKVYLHADSLRVEASSCKDVPAEDLLALRTQISRGLLELIGQLPETPPAEAVPAKKRGIPEHRFKLRIALLMIATKVVVIGWVLFHMRRGVSYFLEGPAAIGILLPVFSAYMTAIWDDLLHARYVDDAEKPQRYIRKPLLYVAYFVFPVYIIALISIINLKITGHIESMSTYFAMIETALGIYIGRMITVVFGKPKDSTYSHKN